MTAAPVDLVAAEGIRAHAVALHATDDTPEVIRARQAWLYLAAVPRPREDSTDADH